MTTGQISDRAQFRRYAEAALASMAGMDRSGLDFGERSRIAFCQAKTMMLLEDYYFDVYQQQALEKTVEEQRARHAIDEPSEAAKVF